MARITRLKNVVPIIVILSVCLTVSAADFDEHFCVVALSDPHMSGFGDLTSPQFVTKFFSASKKGSLAYQELMSRYSNSVVGVDPKISSRLYWNISHKWDSDTTATFLYK